MTILSTDNKFCVSLNNSSVDKDTLTKAVKSWEITLRMEEIIKARREIEDIYKIFNDKNIKANHDSFFLVIDKESWTIEVMVGDFDNVNTKHMNIDSFFGNNKTNIEKIKSDIRRENAEQKTLFIAKTLELFWFKAKDLKDYDQEIADLNPQFPKNHAFSPEEQNLIIWNSEKDPWDKAQDLITHFWSDAGKIFSDPKANTDYVYVSPWQKNNISTNGKAYLAKIIDLMHHQEWILFYLTQWQILARYRIWIDAWLSREAIQFLLDGGYCAFTLTEMDPRCRGASKAFIDSLKDKWGIVIEFSNGRTYTKIDQAVYSTLFENGSKRNEYGSLDDTYQRIVLVVNNFISHQRLQGYVNLDTQGKKVFLQKIQAYVNTLPYKDLVWGIYISKEWFLTVKINKELLSENKKIYTREELTNKKQFLPTRIRKDSQVDEMYVAVNAALPYQVKDIPSSRKIFPKITTLTKNKKREKEQTTYVEKLFQGNKKMLADLLGVPFGQMTDLNLILNTWDTWTNVVDIKVTAKNSDGSALLESKIGIDIANSTLEIVSYKKSLKDYQASTHIVTLVETARTLWFKKITLYGIQEWVSLGYYGYNVRLKYWFEIPSVWREEFFTKWEWLKSKPLTQVERKEYDKFIIQFKGNVNQIPWPLQYIYNNPVMRTIRREYWWGCEQELDL